MSTQEGKTERDPETAGRDLERAAGTVKDVLCWETPGESYAEARGLSSTVDCWDKSPWQLGAKPELQNMPLLATAEHSAAQKQAREAAVSEVNQKTREAEGETRGKINRWDVWILWELSLPALSTVMFCILGKVHLVKSLNASLRFENIQWQFLPSEVWNTVM